MSSRLLMSVSVVAVLLMSVNALAVVNLAPLLTNAGFEDPLIGISPDQWKGGSWQKIRGFDQPLGAEDLVTGLPIEVPGWNSIFGQVADDSGVEQSWISNPAWNGGAVPPVEIGDYSAYLMATDGPVWNTTTTKIVSGETYSLDFWMGDTGSWGTIGVVTGQAIIYGVKNNNVMYLASVNANPVSDWPRTWQLFNITYTDDGTGAGMYIGVMFDNITEADGIAGQSWLGVDIPEPATVALLGLGGLALIRRKR